MLLPIRTNIYPRKTPYVNYGLIIANAVIFILSYSFKSKGLYNWADRFMLTPAYPFLWQFISYAFLHGGVMHIFGNMYFLYIFGNNVNDRLGNIGYLCFYLAGAVFSAIGHILAASMYGSGLATPVLGASGAVAAVTGAYLVLFPQTLITIIYWFFFIGTMEVPAIFLIAFKMIFIDNVIARSAANVAYDAHLAGYAFGIISILALLATRLLYRDDFDLWAMISRWNRRRVYKDAVSKDGSPFKPTFSKKIKVKEVSNPKDIEAQEKDTAVRRDILTRISQGNLAEAANLYTQSAANLNHPLPRQPLLDISNQLMSMSKWPDAAAAYEKFIEIYPNSQHTEQVHLMLGIIYARYLDDKAKGINYLQKAEDKLSDPGQKKMCQDEIKRLLG